MITYFSHDHSSADSSRHKYLALKTSTFYTNARGQLDSIVEESSAINKAYRKVYKDFAFDCPSCGVWPWTDGRGPKAIIHTEGLKSTHEFESPDRKLRQTNHIVSTGGKRDVIVSRKELFDEKGNLVSMFNYGSVPRDESRGLLHSYEYDNAGKGIAITTFDQPAEKQRGDTIRHATFTWSSNRLVQMEEVNKAHVWGRAVTTYSNLVWADSMNPAGTGLSFQTPNEKILPRRHLLSYKVVTIYNGLDSVITTVKKELDGNRRVAKVIGVTRHATKTTSTLPTTDSTFYLYFDDNVIQHSEVYVQSRNGTQLKRGEWRGRKYDDWGRMISQETWVFEPVGPNGRWVPFEKVVFEY